MKLRILSILIMAALITVTIPTIAQTGIPWTAAYYNNTVLQDPPAVTTTVNTLTFDWGAGSPDAAVQSDNWSARFGADVFFNAGTYRFSIRADDEFSLRVNDNVVLSTIGGGQPNNVLTVDVPLSGTTHIQVDYIERTGSASLNVSWQNLSAPTTPIPTGTWLAEYFPNQTLSQPAAAIFNEASPSHNWGFGAPVANMPAEYWSARWRTSQNFAEGSYRFNVQVDDGVRVFVDNVAIIDRFHESPGSTYTLDHQISAGTHTITVEYLELFNNAFLEFSIEQIGTAAPQPPAPGTAAATVTAFVLNVRNAPSATNTVILTKIRRGETYSVLERTADSTWWKIDVNGTIGWVNGNFVTIVNSSSVPATGETPSVDIPEGFVATQGVRVNFRNGPSTEGTEILNVIPTFTAVRVVGRNGDGTWLQVEFAGQTGWVLAQLFFSPTPLNLDAIPVTG